MAILSHDGSFSEATTLALGAFSMLLVLHYYHGSSVHPNEPKVVRPWVPVVGHLVGMAMEGGRYVKRLGITHQAEGIFTLPVPGSRLYIITDPALAAIVQRNSKTLSFTPIIPEVIKRVLGLDKPTMDVVRQNLDPEPGEPRGLLADVHDNVYTLLGPGPYLNELSVDAVQGLIAHLNDHVASSREQPSLRQSSDFLLWIRHFVTFASAEHLFGPDNPLSHDPELEEEFWAFDHGLGGLLMGILPSVTAYKAYRGREKMVAAFRDYYGNGRIEQASKVVQDRHRIERSYGMSDDMVSRSGLSFLFAGVVNTTTTTFWVVLRAFADPELLTTVRAEIEQALIESRELHGANTLGIAQIQESCPTLLAVYRECLRLGSDNSTIRLVKEDMMLNDRHYLKKGGVIQIAGGAMHADKRTWGEDVAEFKPERFMGGSRGSGSNFHPAAFRAFGGGKTLCPGRHFATNEILCFAAMIIRSFEIKAPGAGQLKVPAKDDWVMPVHILEPKAGESPKVLIEMRAEAEALSRLRVVV